MKKILLFVSILFIIVGCSSKGEQNEVFLNNDENSKIVEGNRLTILNTFNSNSSNLINFNLKISSKSELESFIEQYIIFEDQYFDIIGDYKKLTKEDYLKSFNEDYFLSNSLFLVGNNYTHTYYQYSLDEATLEGNNISISLTKYASLSTTYNYLNYHSEILFIGFPLIEEVLSLSIKTSLVEYEDILLPFEKYSIFTSVLINI